MCYFGMSKTQQQVFFVNLDKVLGFLWQFPEDDGGASGPALIKSLINHGLWKDAKMDEVISYLADSKYVNLPEAYVEAFS